VGRVAAGFVVEGAVVDGNAVDGISVDGIAVSGMVVEGPSPSTLSAGIRNVRGSSSSSSLRASFARMAGASRLVESGSSARFPSG
jgi:hypothetical protein